MEAPQKPKRTRIIGIDYGIARIGLSVSDESKMIASPLMTLKADKKSERTLQYLIEILAQHQSEYHYQISEIIMGYPLMMSGKVGFLADEVKHFAELLRQSLSCPIVLWDERLSTVQAERSLREGSLTRKRRSKVVDSVAAVIILQNYLDHKSFSNS
jgi:putative holliday junction resolvase